jgi:anti-sigma28 factor (negative regulator of flagellin synthesis)
MSDLSQQNTESTVMAENTGVSLNYGSVNNARVTTAKPIIQNIHSLPRVRKNKILKVRQQLAEGTYDIDKRLDAVLDRLLEDILV